MFEVDKIKSVIDLIRSEYELAIKEYNVNMPIELIGRSAVHNGISSNSASRNQMLANNLSSSIRTNNPTIKKTMTGAEYEFSKTTLSVKAPTDMVVISVHDVYPSSVTTGYTDSFEKSITFKAKDTGAIGCLKLPILKKFHEIFGTRLIPTDNYHKIEKGAIFDKGDVFLKSPSVDDEGFWRYGTELNCVSASDSDGIEDGIKFSRSACNKLAYKAYGTIRLTFGENQLPLPLYGKGKIFPDVGEFVGEDRVVAGYRTYDPMIEAISMTPRQLSRVGIREDTDKLFYLKPGEHNARIIGVDVQYQANPSRPGTPIGLADQLTKYVNAKTQSAVRSLTELRKFEMDGIPIDPSYHCYSVTNISDLAVLSPNDLVNTGMSFYKDMLAPKMSGSSVLSEYRVVLTYECDIIPNYGQKVTGHSGNKSIITAIVNDDEMYVDKDGNRADCVNDNLSVIKRTNAYALYEPGLNAFLRDVSKYALESIGFNRNLTQEEYNRIKNHQLSEDQYQILMEIYDDYLQCGLIAHRLCFWEDMLKDPNGYKENISRFLLPDLQFNYIPLDNPYPIPTILQMMLSKYEDILIYDRVNFVQNGVMKTTKDRILVSSAYFMVLDRPGTDYQAVSSCKVNHYGQAAKLTSTDKIQAPLRRQPTRGNGEAEERNLAGVNDDLNTSREMSNISNYSNNIDSHEAQIRTAIENPLVLPEISVDRDKVPLGTSTAASMARHILYCNGVKFERKFKQEPL